MANVAELGDWTEYHDIQIRFKSPAVLHHTTFSKRNNFMVIPLTPKNHYYRHNDKQAWITTYGTERTILCDIYTELDKQGKLCNEAREIWEGMKII